MIFSQHRNKSQLITFTALLFILFILLAGCQEQPEETAVSIPTSSANPPTDIAEAANSEAAEETRPYLNPTLAPAERAADLLNQMTLAEKIGQMTLVEKNSIIEENITELAIGALLSGGGGYPADNNPAAWLEMVNGYQAYALETRLAIPLLYGVDAVHGHSNVEGAVLFPHNIALGATRNANLVQEIGRVTALETAATGIFWNYAPTITVPQDIRWGRTYEGYSENTELVTELGQAYLIGLQGDDLTAVDSIIGTAKHFLGDGGTTWGTSTTDDYQIDQGDTQVNEATLRAVHLPPYIAAIDAGARSVMISFSSWNGTKMHEQQYLITDVLKGELGFTGFVVSDWAGIDQVDSNYYEAVVAAINAGIDMNMVPGKYTIFIDALTAAVENGDVPQARIDDAVRRILTVKFELGLFERPFADESLLQTVGSDAHRELARQAVRESLVLLHHDGATLPIDRGTAVIFVAGEGADDIGIQSGGWSIEWQGREGNITPGTTILEGIENTISANTQLNYNRFGNFERITDDSGNPLMADVGIVVVGERPYAEGQGDSNNLTLTEPELNAIERIRARSQKLVVIVLSGRPIIITELLPTADALVAAWLPGTEGSGITDVLFGDYEFTGKLSYTWPRSMDQLPFDFANLPTEGCAAPLFPFGYGLTTSESSSLPDC
ncbi:MAG: beta-glucosidase [Anaerolineaceae bacterium]|nr:beta-glucosidase [Anaerolineaceae bacterium]